VFHADWLPGGREVVSMGESGAVLSRAADGTVVRTFPHKGGRWMAVWPGGNGRLATLDASYGLKVWDLNTGQELAPAVVPPASTRAVAFTPDGQLITGGSDGVVRVWDLDTATECGPPLPHVGSIQGVSVSPDGKRLLVYAYGRTAPDSRLWELPTGRQVAAFDVPPLTLAPALSPDGRTVCVFTRTTAQVVSADDGRPVRTIDLDFNFRPTYSPDGRYIVSPDMEANTVTVREVVPTKLGDRVFPHRPSRRRRTLAVTAVSRDSRYLAISVDSSLVVWDMVKGVQITPPMAVRYAKHMSFDDTARRLLVASVDKVVRVIDLSPDPRPVEELRERAELLANRKLDDGRLVPLPPTEADRLWQKYRPR
jgi:WD40 repeat protein